MIFNIDHARFGSGSYTWDGVEPVEWGAVASDWMMVIPVSGTLTIKASIPRADLCIVAAGMPGNIGSGDHGSSGGNGGEMISLTGISLPAGTYTVTVGESGQNTILEAPDGRRWVARSGYGEPGGGQEGSSGPDGAVGSLAWNDAETILRPGWLYGSSGGRGFVLDYQYNRYEARPGGSVGAASEDDTVGHGGTMSHPKGYAGCKNTGQGGGGGARIWNESSYDGYNGGDGGSGVVLIRRHTEEIA